MQLFYFFYVQRVLLQALEVLAQENSIEFCITWNKRQTDPLLREANVSITLFSELNKQ